jgi:hypothetical protein
MDGGMSNIYESKSVLRLNANWKRIGWATPEQAFGQLMGGDKKTPPALAMHVEYVLDEEGNPDFNQTSAIYPVSWDEWLKLPARVYGDKKIDTILRTVRYQVRIPTIIMCPKYWDMPIKKLRPTFSGVRMRDGNRCQYTGKELARAEMSLDHVIPRSKGGKDSWENLVLCDRKLNSKKGNQFNHEIGLKTLKEPKAPKPIPVCELYKEVKHEDHKFF